MKGSVPPLFGRGFRREPPVLDATRVHEILGKSQLADGMSIVADLDGSHGCWLRDARTGVEYLDAFTCFASWPIGWNHPGMREDGFPDELLRAAMNKISNPDLYTRELAGFVQAFDAHLTPEGFPHHFWVSGGSLAVENALKTAFDWKARKLDRTDYTADVNDLVVVHFRHAFHGRSGYTLSLTNTLPIKVGLFPRFDWPRIHSPAPEFDLDGNICNDIESEERRATEELESAFSKHKRKVAAIIIEPMQAEGGDRHIRPEFLASLREYADAEEALLIFDEVQTGFYGSGRPWLWQRLGVRPDIVAFGKKAQVCGIYASGRVDEVEHNVFRTSSRINSTWGGNLADMVRARRFIEIIERDGLCAQTDRIGRRVVEGLRGIARANDTIRSVRGAGSLIAFTASSPAHRDRLIKALFAGEVLALPCGPDSVRFRLPLIMEEGEADELLSRTAGAVEAAAGAAVGAG